MIGAAMSHKLDGHMPDSVLATREMWVRCHAVNAAVALAVATHGEDATPESVIEYAKRFEDFMETGDK